MPGKRQRNRNQPEGGDLCAAQINRGLNQGIIHLFEGRIDRQDHEGEIGVDNADIDREIGIHDHQGTRR